MVNSSVPNHFILKNTAHFAIKRSFCIKSGFDEKKIIERIKGIASKKVKIICSTSGMFTNSGYGDILFIKIDKNKELSKLHTEIKDALGEIVETKNPEFEGRKYTPHLSLAYNISQDISSSVKLCVDETFLPLNFSLDRLVLLKDFDTEKDEREVIYKHELI